MINRFGKDIAAIKYLADLVMHFGDIGLHSQNSAVDFQCVFKLPAVLQCNGLLILLGICAVVMVVMGCLWNNHVSGAFAA